jgi:hypothetical protein
MEDFNNTKNEFKTLELCLEVIKQESNTLYYVPEELQEQVQAKLNLMLI